MHHRPTDPCSLARREASELDLLITRGEEVRVLRDEIRFLKVEKMRLEREVSELKRKLYGNNKE